MLAELYIFSIVIVAYGTFTTLALIGIGKLRRKTGAPLPSAGPFISIVISARNEEKYIRQCLEQFTKQNYPVSRFEVILVDDASEDNTLDIARAFLETQQLDYTLIRETEHRGKKHCLAHAIHLAKGAVIVTSDADMVFRYSTWLSSIAHYFDTYRPAMLIMPVDFEACKSWISSFQVLENTALTGITAGYAGLGKAFMCNGANLAFSKKAYQEAGGYDAHAHVSSGDDVFLMEAIKRQNPQSIHYLFSRELIARTVPQNNVEDLFRQRLRWASKTRHNPSMMNLFAGMIVLLANLLILALVVAMLKKSWIIPYLSIFVAAKFVFDFLLLFLASDFLGRVRYLVWFFPFECVYWLYAFVIGISSFFIKPSWKGKKTN